MTFQKLMRLRWSSPEMASSSCCFCCRWCWGELGHLTSSTSSKSYSMPAARQPSCRKVRVFPYQAWALCHHFAIILPNLSHVIGLTTTGISPSAAIDVDTVGSANHLEASSRAQVRGKKQLAGGWWNFFKFWKYFGWLGCCWFNGFHIYIYMFSIYKMMSI